MPIIRIPSPLRSYTGGQSEVKVKGKIVSEAVGDLVLQFPSLQTHLFNPQGDLRPFVNLFLNQENIKDMQNLDTPLEENDKLLLIPSIAGGRF